MNQLFKRVTLIALIAQMAYWIIAGALFGQGQLTFHAAVALITATYLAIQLFKRHSKYRWFAVPFWPTLVIVCYQLISYWAMAINWTLDFIPAPQFYNLIRALDIIILSIFSGLAALAIKHIMKYTHGHKTTN